MNAELLARNALGQIVQSAEQGFGPAVLKGIANAALAQLAVLEPDATCGGGCAHRQALERMRDSYRYMGEDEMEPIDSDCIAEVLDQALRDADAATQQENTMDKRTYPCTCGDTLGAVNPMCRAHFPSRYARTDAATQQGSVERGRNASVAAAPVAGQEVTDKPATCAAHPYGPGITVQNMRDVPGLGKDFVSKPCTCYQQQGRADAATGDEHTHFMRPYSTSLAWRCDCGAEFATWDDALAHSDRLAPPRPLKGE